MLFYLGVAEAVLARLSKLVEDLLYQGWILAGRIPFDGQIYLQALTSS